MRMPAMHFGIFFAVTSAALVAVASGAEPLGTGFTYQGQLRQGGVPADGRYDFEFSLWGDARSVDPRDQVGRTLDVSGHLVTNGLFTVQLHFGDGAFPGEARFLEIAVRPAGGLGGFTTLAPRQELTPTPYALMAMNTVGVDGHSLDADDGSPTDAVYVNAVGDVGIGTTSPLAMLDVAGSIAVDGFQMGSHSTAGHVLTTDANGVGTWQAPPAGGSGVWGDGPEDHIYYNDGFVGVGTGSAQTPAQMLHVEGSAYVRDRLGIGVLNPGKALDVMGDARVFNGNLHVGAEGFDPYIELMSDENSDALQMRLKTLDGVGFAIANSADTTLMVVESSTGEVGIGTTAPEHKLHAVGGPGTAVFGSSNGSATASVLGRSIHSNGRGVMGEVTGSGGYGVYGKAAGGAGVRGTSLTADGGIGVEGYIESATGYAVYGFNEAGYGDAIGVYGESGSPDGYGGYFREKLYVTGNVEAGAYKYHTPQERHLSIPGCAFMPQDPTHDFFFRSSGAIRGRTTPMTPVAGTMYAPLRLPDGATVTYLTAYARIINGDFPFTVAFYKIQLDEPGAPTTEIRMMTSLGSGEIVMEEDVNEFVDNASSAYFFSISSEGWNIFNTFDAIVVTYTVEAAD